MKGHRVEVVTDVRDHPSVTSWRVACEQGCDLVPALTRGVARQRAVRHARLEGHDCVVALVHVDTRDVIRVVR